jgi:hypothetical protein
LISSRRLLLLLVPLSALSACATAKMHTEDELNNVALGCGLSYGDVVQEQDAKRLLLLFRVAPKPEQRHCVYKWARKNHLNLVVIEAINEPKS